MPVRLTPDISAALRSKVTTRSPISPTERPRRVRNDTRTIGSVRLGTSPMTSTASSSPPIRSPMLRNSADSAPKASSSKEITVNIEPEVWEIIDGKLYLTAGSLFTTDMKGNRPVAEENWPEVEAALTQ